MPTGIHLFIPIPRTIAIALAAVTSAAPARSGQFDWPQWQGPDRSAHSKEAGLLAEWPKEGPPLAWKTKGLGGGDSTPSVAAGRIYGMSHRGGANRQTGVGSSGDRKRQTIHQGSGHTVLLRRENEIGRQ